jgi:outer membrane protein
MKKSVLILIALVSIVSINAQTKVAHINTQKLLDTLPSRKVALKQISEFQQKGEMELKDMEADLQKTYQKYMAEQNTLTPVMKQYEEERIQKKQQGLQQREQELQQQISLLGNELNAPILKRVQKAVKTVSISKKLNYVIDESTTLYFDGGTDITNDVMLELLRLDASETSKK